MVIVLLPFFFSSRRRHTISLCDWSSDVCSSDLHSREAVRHQGRGPGRQGRHVCPRPIADSWHGERSEERRVGKECRSGWGLDQSEKKRRGSGGRGGSGGGGGDGVDAVEAAVSSS